MTRSRGRAAVVCVPGLGLDDAAWRPTLQALQALDPDGSRRRHAVVPLLGYGVRATRRDDLRPSALAENLVEELVEEPVGGRRTDPPAPVALLAHSASCQIAAHAARLAPDRVCAVVLVGPTTDPRAPSWPRLMGRWLRTATWERPGQVPSLVRMYSRTGLSTMARAMDVARRDDVRETLRQVRCPVLVIRGRHDRICPEDWAATLAATAPAGSRAVTLERGGHMVPLTHGKLVADAVEGFLA